MFSQEKFIESHCVDVQEMDSWQCIFQVVLKIYCELASKTKNSSNKNCILKIKHRQILPQTGRTKCR